MSDGGARSSGEDWVRRFAAATGAEAPDEAAIGTILKLASVAAHSSERLAAPLACWVAGAAGLDLDEAVALAERLEDGG